jgi:hypothetical protein
MEVVQAPFPFAEGIEGNDPSIVAELREMNEVWQAENGLVPKAALKQLFGCSHQAAGDLPGRYALTEWIFLGKKWYSRIECEKLHRSKRASGAAGHSMAAMVRECLDDARKD